MKVVVSMDAPKRNRVYHRPDCVYTERILLQNKMTIPKIEAEKNKYHCCKYCGGLQGEVRVNRQIPVWEHKKHIKIDYDKQSEAVCVRTEIGCWKIFYNERIDRYMLYHRNTYRKELSKEMAMQGAYHRQSDVKPEKSFQKLIGYIVEHDKAKVIMKDDYRKLPRSTKKQRKYYRQAENKFRRQNTRQARQRLDELFKDIENKNPEIKKLAFC